ncbi:MAG: hypothetical protein ACYCYM_11625 [Saccharofermentanales bacterium]
MLGTLHNAYYQMDHGGHGQRAAGRHIGSPVRVFRDVGAYVSCGGYVSILQSVWCVGITKQGGTTGVFEAFVLDSYLSGTDVFLFFRRPAEGLCIISGLQFISCSMDEREAGK